MNERSVLVVTDEGADAAPRVASSAGPSVTTSTDPGYALQRLCREPVAGLVVDETVGGGRGVDIARAARQLFPALPVILRGRDGKPDGLGEPLAAVAADADLAETVAETVAGTETDADRPATAVESIFLSLFEQFPVHLFVKDSRARHVLTNHQHIDPAPVLGRTDDAVSDDESDVFRDAITADDRRVIEKGEALTGIEEYSDKLERYLLTAKVPWIDPDGEVAGLIGITRDVTERRRRERALRSSKERLERVAMKSAHEMRNELQVAVGRLERADGADRWTADVAASLERLTDIADDIVELATGSSEEREPRELRLSAVARETWRTMPGEEAALRIASDALFVADPDGARLLFETVYENALEHAGPDVEITVGRLPDGFYIADAGPGIAVEPPDRVFEACVSTTKGRSGLGLYVARSIADDHEWALSAAESEAGGARFEVTGVDVLDA